MIVPDPDEIEPRFKNSIDLYVSHGVPTGAFLRAVLSNNLLEAIGRGDPMALQTLPHTVSYLYNKCPGICWGRLDKVAAWLARDEFKDPDEGNDDVYDADGNLIDDGQSAQ